MSNTTPAAGMPTAPTLRSIAERIGIAVDCMDMGAASHVYSPGCSGVTQQHLEAFAEAVLALLAKGAESHAQADWREHVENRLRMWRQRRMNRHGDMLVLADFMDAESLEDLIDFVCDERGELPVAPAAPATSGGAPPWFLSDETTEAQDDVWLDASDAYERSAGSLRGHLEWRDRVRAAVRVLMAYRSEGA